MTAAMALALLGGGSARAAKAKATPTPETYLDRGQVLPSGEGQAYLGAGSWLRGGDGTLYIGNLDIRYGLGGGVEVRMLLPGIAWEFLTETTRRPSLVFSLGVTEVGFSPSLGHVFAYGGGITLHKRLASRLAVRVRGELRHRPIGGETSELAVPGPLPPSHAAIGQGELLIQAHRVLALGAGLGYAVALGEGRTFAFGAFRVIARLAARADFVLQVYLEESRTSRVVDPAIFGGLAFHF